MWTRNQTALTEALARLELGEWLPRPAALGRGAGIPTLEELERNHITTVLAPTGWRVSGDRGGAPAFWG